MGLGPIVEAQPAFGTVIDSARIGGRAILPAAGFQPALASFARRAEERACEARAGCEPAPLVEMAVRSDGVCFNML